jgi:hypothetical protein
MHFVGTSLVALIAWHIWLHAFLLRRYESAGGQQPGAADLTCSNETFMLHVWLRACVLLQVDSDAGPGAAELATMQLSPVCAFSASYFGVSVLVCFRLTG